VVVFTGSSSIRFWSTLAADMAPLPVVNRGFGGAQLHQVAYYAGRLILPYHPRAVVCYAGENDLVGALFSPAKSPAQVAAAYARFCEQVQAALPAAGIYFISIKPPAAPRAYWPAMQAANQLIREYCAADPRLHYIDIVSAMLDARGQVRADLYRWYGRHLSAKGYAVWTAIVQPILAADLPLTGPTS
jgi:lysophospholipase L1-like esterase